MPLFFFHADLHAFLFRFFFWIFLLIGIPAFAQPSDPYTGEPEEENVLKNVEVVIPTFLGNHQRNYYGSNPPASLDVEWKTYLGKGKTTISRNLGERTWAGAGWTGQPLLVKENETPFIIQGAYDHHLKKINAETGEVVWQYKFDDVVKGTGSLWYNPNYEEKKNSLVVLQGSRLGYGKYLDTEHVPSYRAISYWTGEELWRHDSKWTHSYSRDVDGSALILNDTAYLGLENSLFTLFDPDYKNAGKEDGMLQPKIYKQVRLYEMEDVHEHSHNVVTESSPSLLRNHIYVASGSGHVYGYNLKTHQLDWDFYVGSDIDGSAVVTSDSSLMVSVEKQYIEGKGGIYKLDPAQEPEKSALWYFPVENNDFSSWKGGVIGSVGINDQYVSDTASKLAAFTGIDGYLYVVDHQTLNEKKRVLGPDSTTHYQTPQLVYKYKVGPSISTPVFFGDKLIVAGYWGLYLFQYNESNQFELVDRYSAPFESTPIAYNGSIYIASRDGYLYCFSGS